MQEKINKKWQKLKKSFKLSLSSRGLYLLELFMRVKQGLKNYVKTQGRTAEISISKFAFDSNIGFLPSMFTIETYMRLRAQY